MLGTLACVALLLSCPLALAVLPPPPTCRVASSDDAEPLLCKLFPSGLSHEILCTPHYPALIIQLTSPSSHQLLHALAAKPRNRSEALTGAAVQVTFGVAELKEMKGADGIDPTVKEKYLSDDDFKETFSMGKDAFAAMPLWRRQQAKKKVGLF